MKNADVVMVLASFVPVGLLGCGTEADAGGAAHATERVSEHRGTSHSIARQDDEPPGCDVNGDEKGSPRAPAYPSPRSRLPSDPPGPEDLPDRAEVEVRDRTAPGPVDVALVAAQAKYLDRAAMKCGTGEGAERCREELKARMLSP